MKTITASTTSLTVTTSSADDVHVMSLLHEHVPLALLCDLSQPEGPTSAEILRVEGGSDDRWWDQ